MNEWTKPQTIFAALFYFQYLMLVSCGLPAPALLEKIVAGLFIYHYGKKGLIKITEGAKNVQKA